MKIWQVSVRSEVKGGVRGGGRGRDGVRLRVRGGAEACGYSKKTVGRVLIG